MFKIAVLVSGGGSNLQSIIDKIEEGYIKNCKIEMVIGDRPNIYGIERAEKKGIRTLTLDRKIYKNDLSNKIFECLYGKVDLIVLAGWLSILNGDLINKFENKIINIHPSLIPSFCGDGMYGIKVHQKALEYGVKVSGCTVHFVDEDTDSGPIIIQKSVPVFAEDTAKILQKRVLDKEHEALPEAIKLISEEKVKLQGRKVFIKID
ncbi:phosphoribosylglycinamide formyltransferase [Clostridium botulinum]|uniref:Phosphoribosylglycinamide formyltransferase n=1 Tax=Clostridium botulinum TaxID=1491 RepID=A0A846J7A8_CLOBO|nr:phosphoribosylglycinamide formyltransferase [Clostridium botulinum]ACA57211.1 phosphoribosylglycinamide formyltransferase [Clostridium botulinum A3 str. Loch Maree]NFH66679.1 phosphoribosylglycinamide formyltransferase [Clostridium botulinum]NFJ07743.1 phosphoribosylglycinamide formyltransferase [Clostridium botulinum]NFK13467.1 phosphoribosylglycinamide formyltransferase [Clostridium botulinum]NFM93405.1 phosphoribosylglycinamide formyltransferase [Clostridium botulinum]